MRAYFELPAFAMIAVALMMLGFAINPPVEASASSGAGGEDLVTMEASTASVETMVEDWLAPPEVVDTPDMPEPQIDMAAVEMPPAPPTRPTEAPTMQMPAVPDMVLPDLPSLPDAAMAELPPPPKPEPEPVPEPVPDTEPEVVTSQLAPVASERPQVRPDRLVPEPPRKVTKAQPKPKPTNREKPVRKKAPAKAPSKASADSAGQRAAGAGGGAQAGQARAGSSATTTKAQQNNLKASWGASIRSRVERRKRYPGAAGRASGTVGLWLKVTSTGGLAGAGISRSSGNAALDQAALSAVRSARMPSAPRGLTQGTHSFTLSMKFSR
ncbi:TonB family protein [Puniceibacterium sp. IMCC21224]|uniref:TonB family protein n=1 Tax=Puniceibacterium sp. IMCC21224 TaxID=1618204 RepID=UPI00065D2EBB|nr:TonB family protein [Puniceibacterium sp. IMCC21224]KMK67008.1 TonB family protein [Puniceibacterium sp. IMCC21224]